MRRCALLLMALLMALPWAAAETPAWPGEGSGRMRVVNCEDWVSLRAQPYTSSEKLAEVRLNESVIHCRKHSADFTHCETYSGQQGYILTKYLAEPEFRILSASELTPDAPVLSDPTDFVGGWQLDFVQLGLKVLCLRDYAVGERLRASCFDAGNRFVWGMYTEALSATELDLTDAYAGGTVQRPLLIVNNADLGLAAIDLATGQVAWTVDGSFVELGASQAHALADDGTLYVGGYYEPDPVAISADGRVLWRSNAGEDAVWLCELRVAGGEVIAEYDAPDGDGLGTVCFERETGQVISAEPLPPS